VESDPGRNQSPASTRESAASEQVVRRLQS
jgi:hypothetical protein